MWAYAREASYKRAIRAALDKEKHCKKQAEQLRKYVLKTFTAESYAQGLADNILQCLPPEDEGVEVDIDSWLEQLEVSEYD